jgi:hypothetical protein
MISGCDWLEICKIVGESFESIALEYVDIPCYNEEVKFDANRQREGFLC